jgi:hypothetical protein
VTVHLDFTGEDRIEREKLQVRAGAVDAQCPDDGVEAVSTAETGACVDELMTRLSGADRDGLHAFGVLVRPVQRIDATRRAGLPTTTSRRAPSSAGTRVYR